MQQNTAQHIFIAGETNKGICRSKNEDSFCICADRNAVNVLAVVADGVGGHTDGDVASFLCCRSLLRQWRNNRFAEKIQDGGFGDILPELIRNANREIYEQNIRAGKVPGMCTTVVAAVFAPGKITVCNVGDSPFMILRKGVLHQLTEDHNWGGYRNVISRALGVRSVLEIDTQVIDCMSGDRCLLCTDGLSHTLPEEKIRQHLDIASAPGAAVDNLLKAALLAGGRDNITAVAMYLQ